jgi:hypothetical protein
METLLLGSRSVDDLPGDIKYLVLQAKREAEQLGIFFRSQFTVTEDIAKQIVQREKSSYGVVLERDKDHQATVARNLFAVLVEALGLQYNITDLGLQKALMGIAAMMQSTSYQPMRVMGATAEAFKT